VECCHTLEVLLNALQIEPEYLDLRSVVAKMFDHQSVSGILASKSYDDSGWVALSWIRAYEDTRDEKYLKRAKVFYKQILEAWDDFCGGGLYWAGDQKGGGLLYKNAVTNELFIYLSLKMRDNVIDLVEKNYYLNWAIKTWKWFKNSGMIIQNLTSYWVLVINVNQWECIGVIIKASF